jgi:thiamine monophosphate kinase
VDEFSLINKYFDWDQGIGDDCALISIDHGKQLATTVDTLIEGVHFPASTSAQDIAYKALAVNLSDLAAMGATPLYFTLALSDCASATCGSGRLNCLSKALDGVCCFCICCHAKAASPNVLETNIGSPACAPNNLPPLLIL